MNSVIPSSVSVIIPTYNRARIVPCAIESVTSQTLQPAEIIVIDDGSTDNTAEVIEQIQQKYPSQRIHYHYQDNQGPSAARNQGTRMAIGDYVVYLDSDDTMRPTALFEIANALSNPHAQYGIPNHTRTVRLLDDNGAVLAQKDDSSGNHKDLTLQDVYDWKIRSTSSGIFLKKDLFNRGVEWKSGFWIEDLDFLLSLGRVAPDGFVHIPQTLVDYTQSFGGGGLCSNASYMDWAKAFLKILERHINDPLMKHPEVYRGRVDKYLHLDAEEKAGRAPPQRYQKFPEFWHGGPT